MMKRRLRPRREREKPPMVMFSGRFLLMPPKLHCGQNQIEWSRSIRPGPQQPSRCLSRDLLKCCYERCTTRSKNMKKVPLTVFEIYSKGARPLCKSPHTTSTCVFPITWGNVVRRLMQTAEMSKTMRMRGMMRCEQIFFSRLEKNTFFFTRYG